MTTLRMVEIYKEVHSLIGAQVWYKFTIRRGKEGLVELDMGWTHHLFELHPKALSSSRMLCTIIVI